MYVSTQRPIARMPSVLKYMLWLGLGLALTVSARTGLGQDDLTPLARPKVFRSRPEVFRSQSGEPGAEPDTMRATPNMPQTEIGDAVQDGLLFGDQLSGRTGEA